MLRKQIIQSLNKKSFSSINKQNVLKTASLSMKSVQPRIMSKSFYSSDNGDGARFDDKFMNVSVEDFVAYGLSIATVYYILDSIFGEKKPEPVEEKTEEVESIKEEVEESQPVMEEEKNATETADVDEIAKKNDEEEAVNDTLALEEENAVEDTKVLEEENLANEQTAQEEAVEEITQKEAVAEESTEEAAPSTEEVAPATEEGAVDPSAGPAYNPETGEINWDCPCLGGMAHGPCGEEFKTAFSCFIYSEAEPKGVDCVEKFQGMQECFKKHPEIYAEQLRDDDEVEHAHPVEEQPTEITEAVVEAAAPAAEPETVVEEVLVGDVPAAVIEEVVPIVEEKVEEITPIVEEKVEEIVAKTEDANIIPEAAEELIEEGLPINADD